MHRLGSSLLAGNTRLLLELLAIIAGAEVAIHYFLVYLAPNASGVGEALLDAALLTALAGPMAVWRANRILAQRQAPAQPRSEVTRVRSWAWPALVFLLGLLLSLLGAWLLQRSLNEVAHARFDRQVQQLQERITERFEQTLHGFHGIKSTIAMQGGELTPAQFRVWVAARDVGASFAGIRGLGFIKRVERRELAAFIEAERAKGAPQFSVRTSGHADDLYVISRIEPLSNNLKAWGYDVGSELVRRTAAEAAVKTGRATLTGRITLVQDGQKRPGFLYFMPVFKAGVNPATAQARQAALVGLIYAPIVAQELLGDITEAFAGQLDFAVFDGATTDPAQVILQAHGGHQGPFDRSVALNIGGRTLTLGIASVGGVYKSVDRSGPIWLALLGTVLSTVIAVTVWLLSTGRMRAEELAGQMTVDLQQAKQAAEAALRESQVLLRTLSQFSMVCVTAPDGTMVEVNEAFCQASGYSREELLGRNPRIVASQVQDAFFWVNVWQTLLHGQPWSGVLCNQSKQGQPYWVQCVISPILGADGQVERYISTAYDITATRQAQEELKANAERYNLAIEGGNDGLWDWMNVHAQAEWWSPQFYRLLGYTPDEIEADLAAFDEMLHPDDQQATFAALEAALQSQQPFDVEYRMRTKAGDYRWFRNRASVYFDEFGQASRMAGSIQDIHDRKLAQALLQEHSEQMGAIFSLSPDGFVSFDAEARVSYVSPAWAQLTGLPAHLLVGLSEQDFSARFFQQAVAGQVVASMDDVRRQSARVVIEMKPPAKRMLEVRVNQGQGAAVSQVLALRDVTHETEVDQMKSSFLSMAAHELRTPMASIYGFTELLLTRELKPEKQKDLLGRIYRQSEAMSAIINELLDLARIESRQGKDFSFEAHNLSDLVAQVVGDFKTPVGREAPIVSWPTQAPAVWVDKHKMQQAVLNLLSNAYKYSPQGGDVRIEFKVDRVDGRDQVGVEVIDHGLGLTPEQLARVGERFFRADKSGNIPGTGLGMTIVKEIVEAMGGRLSLSSQFGEGTQAAVWVPLFEQEFSI